MAGIGGSMSSFQRGRALEPASNAVSESSASYIATGRLRSSPVRVGLEQEESKDVMMSGD